MLLKILGPKGEAIHGGTGSWHLPKDGQPGAWMPAVDTPVPCERGYHLATPAQAPVWLVNGCTIWEAEGRGVHVDRDDKSAWAEARLIRRLRWSKHTAALFAADCAERVLPIFEQRYPQDDRPRKAIEAARQWARGEIAAAARAAAGDAAGDAAGAAYVAAAAAGDAAGGAAWWWDTAGAAYAAAYAARRNAADAAYAAAAAAGDAAGAAARDAAGAAYAAAYAARDAAGAAARDAYVAAYAARDAAGDAARAAAGAAYVAVYAARDAAGAAAAEREWQGARLLDYLEGRA
jgi:hypothetical protein